MYYMAAKNKALDKKNMIYYTKRFINIYVGIF